MITVFQSVWEILNVFLSWINLQLLKNQCMPHNFRALIFVVIHMLRVQGLESISVGWENLGYSNSGSPLNTKPSTLNPINPANFGS